MEPRPVPMAGAPAAPPISWRTGVAVAATILLWASAFAGIRAGLASYSPAAVALLRYLAASLLLGAYALAVRLPLPRRRDLPAIALLGGAGFTFYNVALNAGEQEIPAGTASLLIAAAPIFVALLAAAMGQEKLGGRAWLGTLLGFGGVALISLEPGQQLALSASALLVLAAAAAQAVYSVAQKPLLRRYSPLQFTAMAIWLGTLGLLWATPDLIRQWPTAAPAATLAVLYLGIFPGALGYLSWSYVLSQQPAARAGSFLYLIPVAAIIIAWFWLGEAPRPAAMVGGGLILAGVTLVNLARRRASQATAATLD